MLDKMTLRFQQHESPTVSTGDLASWFWRLGFLISLACSLNSSLFRVWNPEAIFFHYFPGDKAEGERRWRERKKADGGGCCLWRQRLERLDEGVRRKGEQEAAGRISEQSPNHHERAKPKFPSGDVTAQKTSTCIIHQLEMPVPSVLQNPCCLSGPTHWAVLHRAPPSMGFFRQENWSFLPQGIFPTQGLNPNLLCFLPCSWILYHWAMGGAHRIRKQPFTMLDSKTLYEAQHSKCFPPEHHGLLLKVHLFKRAHFWVPYEPASLLRGCVACTSAHIWLWSPSGSSQLNWRLMFHESWHRRGGTTLPGAQNPEASLVGSGDLKGVRTAGLVGESVTKVLVTRDSGMTSRKNK